MMLASSSRSPSAISSDPSASVAMAVGAVSPVTNRRSWNPLGNSTRLRSIGFCSSMERIRAF
jgi:hypothetical protein